MVKNKSQKNSKKNDHKGKPFINIGTKNSCLFLNLSKRLIEILKRNPLLYFAIEESQKCASIDCYSAGILACSQILNCYGKKTSPVRHKVAHEILINRPNKKDYEAIFKQLKSAAEESYFNELDGSKKNKEKFNRDLVFEWSDYARDLFIESIKNEK